MPLTRLLFEERHVLSRNNSSGCVRRAGGSDITRWISCMIWLLRPDHPKATEFAPAMDEGTGILPGLPPVAGKPVHLTL